MTKTNWAYRLACILMLLVAIPFGLVLRVFKEIHEMLRTCITIAEGVSMLDMMEGEFRKDIEKAEKNLQKIEEMRKYFN